MIRALSVVALAFALPAEAVRAHNGVDHANDAERTAHAAGAGLPLPLDLGGPFALIDQHGRPRTQIDPDGNLQLLFFGYANCQQICSAALPQMGDVAAALGLRGIAVTPLMITVDPERDTPDLMAEILESYAPDFLGLTGDAAALSRARAAFQIESTEIFDDPATGPVYAHGSFIYLLTGSGDFLTALPPILPTDQLIELVAGYAS